MHEEHPLFRTIRLSNYWIAFDHVALGLLLGWYNIPEAIREEWSYKNRNVLSKLHNSMGTVVFLLFAPFLLPLTPIFARMLQRYYIRDLNDVYDANELRVQSGIPPKVPGSYR